MIFYILSDGYAGRSIIYLYIKEYTSYIVKTHQNINTKEYIFNF